MRKNVRELEVRDRIDKQLEEAEAAEAERVRKAAEEEEEGMLEIRAALPSDDAEIGKFTPEHKVDTTGIFDLLEVLHCATVGEDPIGKSTKLFLI
jgi:hypothetical protein